MNKIIWTAVVLVAIVLIVLGISRSSDQVTSDKNLKIGVLAVLSGEGASWGENAKRGIDLAVEDYKKAHPDAEIELLYEDTAADAKKAISGFQKLITIDGVDAIIGPLLQAEVAALAPIMAEQDIPVVAPSYAPLQNRPNPQNPFVTWMDATAEAHRMANYVASQGVKTIAVIGTKDAWESEVSTAFAEKAKEIGINVVGFELVQPDFSTDMRLTVTKILAQKPEAIFLGTYYQFVNSITALDQFQYAGKLYSIEVDSYLAGETANRLKLMQFIGPDFYTSEFSENFENKYGIKPGIPAGQAYDATSILLSALEDGRRTQKVTEQLSKIKSWDGVSGLIQFTSDGKILMPTALFELKSGEISRLMELK